ncbi:class I SAM-dependent methyltransferase [Kytococcus sedentarius]|uniref:class I SAM-dependent methyltransferase n=1 Tax=Kytococcus sedentarius TaxID=1276 RepID=UPI0035BC19A5
MPHDHFTERAATWDDDAGTVRRSRAVADAVRSAVPLTGTEHLLEYGAGTGLVSAALLDHVGRVTLVDRSAGMREVAERKVGAGVFPPDTRVLDLDLGDATVPPELAGTIDLVVCSLVLHHVPDVPRVLTGFRELLTPGGHVAIVDLDSDDGEFHAQVHDFDGHDGFDRERLSGWLGDAGFTAVAVGDAVPIEKHGTTFTSFLATGVRA